ncbi:MAG: HD domain-containing protein [Candidatus Moraniibacteriota bacterium]|nr:MAG: HD domain-containing protein [Candidatus Moranbacteria bacterium]
MNSMKLKIHPAAVLIVKTLQEAGYEAEIVGGAVRDLLLNLASYDWDITTNATPEYVEPLFKDSFYDNEYGTVKVAGKHLKEQFQLSDLECDDSMIFDITTYRSESGYTDKRRPDKVVWGKTIEEDLKRRDFTINALALRVKHEDLVEKKEEYDCEIVDPYGGQEDIKSKVIRAVGVPIERFNEDALRIMRAIRLAAQLGFTIETETFVALKATVSNLKEISWERIGAEVMKLLATEHAADGIVLMANTGILEIIMPELIKCRGIMQGGHHTHDVYTHLIESLRGCSSSDPVVRLATLLHDIDKPTVVKAEGPRGVTFHNHEVVGARTAKRIAERLKLPKKDQDKIFTLVRWHMFHYDPKMTDSAIRRFIRRVGVENIHDMIALRIGDRIGSGAKTTSWRLTELQKRIGEQLYEPLSLKDMAVDGGDVMRILNIKPSRKIGEILNTLFEEIIEYSGKNTKEYLEKRIVELG